MSETKWFLAKDGAAVGPFDLVRLRQMAAAGEVGRDDLVCPEGGSEWAAATTAPGLFPPAPPPPPSRAAGAGKKLVPCEKCGQRVSDTADTCPHCGEHQPKWVQKQFGWPGDSCERCGVFNIVSLGFGRFLDQPGHRCRGCGCPLTESAPQLHLESEMQRVYANSRVLGNTCGWAAAVLAFVLHWSVYGIDGGGLVVRLAVAAAAYCVTSFLVARTVRARGARGGFGNRSPKADQMAGRNWDLAHQYRQSDTPRAARSPQPGPPAAGTSPLKMVIGAVVLFGAAYLYRTEFTQYELGRKAGVQHVREMSTKGAFIRAGMQGANALDLIPNNPDASADWNAGFRVGFKEELERMRPALKSK